MLYDGNGKKIERCVEMDTKTGEALIFIDPEKISDLPYGWELANYEILQAYCKFKLPITCKTPEGVEFENETQMIILSGFNSLRIQLDNQFKRFAEKQNRAFAKISLKLDIAIRTD